MLCEHCGKTVRDRSKFCPSCGKPPSSAPQEKRTRKLSAAELQAEQAQEKRTRKLSGVEIETEQTPLQATQRVDDGGMYVPPVQSQSPPDGGWYRPPGQSGAPPPPPMDTPKKRPSRLLLMIIAGFFTVLVLIAAIVFIPRLFSSAAGGDEMIIGFPNRNGETDLYLLERGDGEDDGIRIAKNAIDPYQRVSVYENSIYVKGISFGGFVPKSNHIFTAFEDGEYVVQQMTIRDEELSEVLEADDVVASIQMESDLFFAVEYQGTSARCYVAPFGEEADRIVKADLCHFSQDGSTIIFEDIDNDAYQLSFINVDGTDEIVVLDRDESPISYKVSDDASHIAYVEIVDENQQLRYIEMDSGTDINIGNEVTAVIDYGFAPKQDSLFYIIENENGELQLFTIGSPDPIGEDLFLYAGFDPTGEYLIYLIGDAKDEVTAYSYSMKSGESTEIMDGEAVHYSIPALSSRVLFMETTNDQEVTIYSSNFDGTDVLELFNDDMYSVAIQYVPEKDKLYLHAFNEDGVSLFVTSANEENGYYLLEEWNDIRLLNVSHKNEKFLAYAGVEDSGDDMTLYSIEVKEDADWVELDDDADRIDNAIFTPNDRLVMYTAKTGNDANDVSVSQVDILGEENPDEIYDKAEIVDVRWGNLWPFRQLPFSLSELKESSSFCPGSRTIQVGDTIEDRINSDEQNCYRLRLAEGDVTSFRIDSSASANGFDSTLALYDDGGNRLYFNDDGPSSLDAYLTTLMDEDGIYFLMVAGILSDNSAEYTLSIVEGSGDPAVADAQQLIPNSPIEGSITSGDNRYLETHNTNLYGDFYYFDAQSGDQITLQTNADANGSSLDSRLYLFDFEMDVIDNDDDSGDGLDSYLTYTIAQSGRYYVGVWNNDSDEYGSASNYFYEIVFTKE